MLPIDLAKGSFQVCAVGPEGVDLPGFRGERLAHFERPSLEGDGALEAER
ncbi:hypothetical protein [Anianabacter salinae]|nr:hypothetical protein [Anianabacter salinae]MBV0914179.1 hypothetical protein [Anianabacter salinae]